MGKRRAPEALLAALLAASCAPPAPSPPAPSPPIPSAPPAGSSPSAELFVDATAGAGLGFVHENGMAGDHSIVEVLSGGGALIDVDQDGDLDLYLVQSRPIAVTGRTPPADRLYRNELVETGRLRFVDVSEAFGLDALAGRGYGLGATVGDVDHDGYPDLYLTAWGPNQLLLSRGGKAFEDVTERAGADDPRLTLPALLADFDADGWLDLWIGGYVEVPDAPPRCRLPSGLVDYCGPSSFRAEPDRLLRNLGAEGGSVRFVDVTAASGLAAAPPAPALGALAADLDGDGRLDLYVANDGAANFQWQNRGAAPGELRFTDEALLAGTALNGSGQAEGSMGVDAADVDGDGDLDLFLTHLVAETNTLYRNDGGGLFTDVSTAAGLAAPSRIYTAFGTAFLDADLDGWEDLVVANGDIKKIEALMRAGDPFPLHQPNQFFRNQGGGRFTDATARAGTAFAASHVSRGVLVGDVDNDGDPDVVVLNNNGPARLLLSQARAPWLGVRLVEGEPPRDAPGARAAIVAGGVAVRWRRVRTDGSYLSAGDPRIVFALAGQPRVEAVRVVWANGTTEDFPGVEAGRYTTLRKGRGTR